MLVAWTREEKHISVVRFELNTMRTERIEFKLWGVLCNFKRKVGAFVPQEIVKKGYENLISVHHIA